MRTRTRIRISLALVGITLAVAAVVLQASPRASAAPQAHTPAVGNVSACTLHWNGFNGSVQCWGHIDAVGSGFSSGAYRAPVPVVSLGNVASINASGFAVDHMCATMVDGTLKCWGANNNGQLGQGASGPTVYTPVTVPGISNAQYVTASEGHTCVLRTTGAVSCWGNNDDGQLGNGTTVDSASPIAVPGITNATWISAGLHHTCVALADGSARCWGLGIHGQLGNGASSSSSLPVVVSGLAGTTRIDAGGSHTCANGAPGGIACWGNNSYGQLGNGTTNASNVPVAVIGSAGAGNVTAGALHSCFFTALGAGADIRCWGANASGQLGNGGNADSSTPVAVSGFAGIPINWLDAGGVSTCVVLQDGTTRCWGRNFFGQLGNCSTTDSNVPVVVKYDDSDCDAFLDATPGPHEGPANTNPMADNCPMHYPNAPQINTDGNFIDTSPPRADGQEDKTRANSDRLGDACDDDDDNDGLADGLETSIPCGTATGPTNPLLSDTDGDRVLDGAECALASNPNSAASKPVIPNLANDPDVDRLSTAFETTIGTKPNDADSDHDGLADGIEVKGYNTNPLVANTDGDTCGDRREVANVDPNTTVNAQDNGIVASLFGTPGGHANMDIDKNGAINGADIAHIAAAFGACP